MTAVGPGVLVPEAFIRQQNQEKNENGKWIAKNYNIYIYPVFDCNLYELHEDHYDKFNEAIIGEIINQCFNRNDLRSHLSKLHENKIVHWPY